MKSNINKELKRIDDGILVENGADIEAVDSFGMTPLMHASEEFNIEAVEVLLNRGANPHKSDNDGTTPLMFASRAPDDFYENFYIDGSYQKIFKLLFEKGVDINAKDNNGDTALHYACRYLSRKREIIEILINNGADVNIVNNDGVSALMYVCDGMFCFYRTEMVQLLIENGADVNIVSKNGETALTLLKELEDAHYDEREIGYEHISSEDEQIIKETVKLIEDHACF